MQRFLKFLLSWLKDGIYFRQIPRTLRKRSEWTMASPTTSHQVSKLLQAWGQGDEAALNQLLPLVHAELRRLARRYMFGERAGHTLQTTALVNEAYLRLVKSQRVNWQNRTHFFAVTAQLMRRILVDSARARDGEKRGGGVPRVTLDEAFVGVRASGPDLVALDDALQALSEIDPRKGRVVELRFFGGLNVEETAEVLKVAPNTVLRDWKFAKMWLKREMSNARQATDRGSAVPNNVFNILHSARTKTLRCARSWRS
jgi:RNA polymerase sigma-70 factor, ECF subfamily